MSKTQSSGEGSSAATKEVAIETFTETCSKPYDRHRYRMYLKSGKAMVLDDYEQARRFWYQFREQLDRIEVLD